MKSIFILLSFFIISCSGKGQQLQEIAKLNLKEVSGIDYAAGSDLLWAIEDSGNKNILYGLGKDGKESTAITITNVQNNDWEDITSDKDGNIYIGDFGNNDNERKNLAIYKIDKGDLSKSKAETSSIITFYYPQQKEFPPKKSERIFDVEAFFIHNDNFYLFTKNRSSGFDGSLSIYKIPNKAGNHAALLMGTITTCGKYKRCAVTGAAISPDGTKAVLLSADKIYVITDFGTDNFANGQMKTYDLNHFTQKEGICFKDNDTVIIADEKDKKSGGYIYEVTLSGLESNP